MNANSCKDATKYIGVCDFEEAFGEKLSPYVVERISEYSFQYSELTNEEKRGYALAKVKV